MGEKDEEISTKVKVEGLHSDMLDMKRAIAKLTEAVTHLAIVDERIAQLATMQMGSKERFDKIDNMVSEMRGRIISCETAHELSRATIMSEATNMINSQSIDVANSKRTSVWVERALLVLAGLATMYIAKKTGLVI
jgi:hypothetical protein